MKYIKVTTTLDITTDIQSGKGKRVWRSQIFTKTTLLRPILNRGFPMNFPERCSETKTRGSGREIFRL